MSYYRSAHTHIARRHNNNIHNIALQLLRRTRVGASRGAEKDYDGAARAFGGVNNNCYYYYYSRFPISKYNNDDANVTAAAADRVPRQSTGRRTDDVPH